MIKRFILSILLSSCLAVIASFIIPNQADAQNSCNITVTANEVNIGGQTVLSATIDATNITYEGNLVTSIDDSYYFNVPESICSGLAGTCHRKLAAGEINNGTLNSFYLTHDSSTPPVLIFQDPNRTYTIQLARDIGAVSHPVLCSATFSKASVLSCSGNDIPDGNIIFPPSIDRNTPTSISILGAPQKFWGKTLYLHFIQGNQSQITAIPINISASGGATQELDINAVGPSLDNGTYTAVLKLSTDVSFENCNVPKPFEITGQRLCKITKERCVPGENPPPCRGLVCSCDPGNPTFCFVSLPTRSTFSYFCKLKNPATCDECEEFPDGKTNCHPAPASKQTICDAVCGQTGTANYLCSRSDGIGLSTAIGCITIANVNQIFIFFLTWGVRFVSGLAFLMIILASIMIIISQGNPERLKAGKELLTAAISGILMLIFSVFIIRIIGVSLLNIFT